MMTISIADQHALAENWPTVTLRGVLALTFGIIALAAPRFSLIALVITFTAYAAVDGVLALISAFGHRRGSSPWWTLVLHGVAGIAMAALAGFYPGMTVLVLMYLIAAWSVISGAATIATAIRLRKSIHNEWLLGLTGVLSLALGVLLFLYPVQGTLVFVMWVGLWAIAAGLLLVGLSLRLRHYWHEIEHGMIPDHAGDVAHHA